MAADNVPPPVLVTTEILSSADQIQSQPPPPQPQLNPNHPVNSPTYAEARFLYRFLYLQNQEKFMTTYFQMQSCIDKFCSFHTSFGSVQYVQFIVHLPMRGRPSVFKSLPSDGFIEGPLPLPYRLKDFAKFYQHENAFQIHDNGDFRKPLPVQTLHQFIMENLFQGRQTLADMFLDAHIDVNIQLRSYILKHYDYYSQEEKLSRSIQQHHNFDRYNSDTFHEIIQQYKSLTKKDSSRPIRRRQNRSRRRRDDDDDDDDDDDEDDHELHQVHDLADFEEDDDDDGDENDEGQDDDDDYFLDDDQQSPPQPTRRRSQKRQLNQTSKKKEPIKAASSKLTQKTILKTKQKKSTYQTTIAPGTTKGKLTFHVAPTELQQKIFDITASNKPKPTIKEPATKQTSRKQIKKT